MNSISIGTDEPKFNLTALSMKKKESSKIKNIELKGKVQKKNQ